MSKKNIEKFTSEYKEVQTGGCNRLCGFELPTKDGGHWCYTNQAKKEWKKCVINTEIKEKCSAYLGKPKKKKLVMTA
jgi:hypothetical protein